MKINAYTLNSFAKSENGGNEAGVVFNADNLSDIQMKKIAFIIGFSETAFVMKSDKADFKIRFFTPNEEVDLCGHATIATFYTMSKLGYIGKGLFTQETKAGILEIQVKDNHFIMMEQSVPIFSEIMSKDIISDSLNINPYDICDDLEIQIVSTGLRDILVPIKNKTLVDSIKPDMNKIKNISHKYNTIGYHIFSLDTLFNSTAYCRNFAPLYDIPEESATGTSNGALACYLYKYGKVEKNRIDDLIFEQGYSMKKPSVIYASLTTKNNQISSVHVGGSAMNLSLKEYEI